MIDTKIEVRIEEPIQEFLNREGRKMEWLAREVGISIEMLRRYRKHLSSTPPEVLAKLAEVIGVEDWRTFYVEVPVNVQD